MEQIMAKEIDPRLLESAKRSGTLRRMIQSGAPLTREKWISMAYLGHPPHPWTAEHEMDVPEPFRLGPPDTVD
jgi:hypothetical protein